MINYNYLRKSKILIREFKRNIELGELLIYLKVLDKLIKYYKNIKIFENYLMAEVNLNNKEIKIYTERMKKILSKYRVIQVAQTVSSVYETNFFYKLRSNLREERIHINMFYDTDSAMKWLKCQK